MLRGRAERWGVVAAVALAVALVAPGAGALARSWGQAVPVGQGSSAAVASDALGNALVGYTDGSTVQVRTRSPTGVLGPPVTLGQGGYPDELRELHIAMDAEGNAVVAWIDVPGGAPPFRVLAAIRPAGGAFGPAQVVGDDVHGRDNFNLAIARGGWAAIVWDHAYSPDYTKASIRPPGGDFGAPERVSPDEQTIDAPRIAIDSQGGAVATWDNFGVGGEMAARPPGGPWGAVERFGSGSTAPQWPGIGIDGQGNALAGFNAAGASVQARYRPAGGAFGSPEPVSPPERHATSVGTFVPSPIGFDSSGTATVLWNDLDSGQLFASTRPSGGGFGAATTLSQGAANGGQLAVSADGSAIALWTTGTSDYGPRPLTAAVRAAGGAFGASRAMAAAATDFSLAADASGDGLAAWTEPSATCGHLVAVAAYSDAPSTMDPTPPGCAVPPPDTTPPAISLTGPKRQRPLQRHHVVLSLRCDENCQMKVSASVKMRGARRPLSLKPVSRKLKGGRRAALVLALSARVTKALAGLLAGQRASLVVTASARDAAGNSAAAKRTIALTR